MKDEYIEQQKGKKYGATNWERSSSGEEKSALDGSLRVPDAGTRPYVKVAEN